MKKIVFLFFILSSFFSFSYSINIKNDSEYLLLVSLSISECDQKIFSVKKHEFINIDFEDKLSYCNFYLYNNELDALFNFSFSKIPIAAFAEDDLIFYFDIERLNYVLNISGEIYFNIKCEVARNFSYIYNLLYT